MFEIPKKRCDYYSEFYPDSQEQPGKLDYGVKCIGIATLDEEWLEIPYLLWYAIPNLPLIKGIIAEEEYEFD